MRHERATEEIQERAALYALGALTQHEARSFETHLREGCPACQTLSMHFDRIVDGLGFGSPGVEPASYLNDLLLARIEREPHPAAAPTPDPIKKPELELKHSEPARPILTPPPPRRGIFPWILAVFLLAAAALCFYLLKQAERQLELATTHEREEASAAQEEVDKLRALLEQEKEKARELEQISSTLASPGAHVIFLTGRAPETPASAVVFWDTQKNRWTVIGHLPPAPAGKEYQLWFVTPTAKISAGLLKTDSTGHSFTVIELSPVITTIISAAISLEPEGGAELPTLPFFLLAKSGQEIR